MKKVMMTLAVGLLVAGCSKQQYSLPNAGQNLGAQVTFNTQVDVLLVVDNSPSMSLYQDRLADQAGSLVTELNRLGMDYQIAAVHSDMRSGMNGGKYIGDPKFLVKGQADLVDQLKSRIRLGNSGSDLERGIESMMKTLESDYLSGEGRGFIRDQALLAIIVLSSEDDWSSNSLSSVKTKLDEVKRPFSSGTKAWTLNLIGVPNLQSSCSTSTESGYREPGLRWIDLVNYTNGVIEPICNTDLGQAVANVRKRIVNILTEFVLDRKPVVETIVVTKNGVPVPQSTENGWEYIEEGRILRLHGTAIPMDGDQIFLDYKPAEGT